MIALGALLVDWPQNPGSYLPSFIPWPGSTGIHVDFLGFRFDRQGFRLGLDLQGGTHLVLQADTSKVSDPTEISQRVDGVEKIIERRINAYGVSEPIIQRQGDDRIIVDLAGIKNVEEAKNLIGKTAQMDFCEQKSQIPGQPAPGRLCASQPVPATANQPPPQQYYVSTATGSDGTEKELTGAYLTKADVSFDQTNRPQINFTFNSDGGTLFGQITTRIKGKQLGIFLDGQPLQIATVQDVIKDQGRITGGFTLDEAKNISIQLNAGALPLPVSVIQETTVDATLGADSVRKSVVAGEIGLLVVALFMILYYRVLGVVAVTALLVYSLLVLAIFKLWPVTLTLAGTAGFILSLGMAVDANILIFERMKEELRSGRTVGAAIEEGFRRAWPSIRDSNVSTMITCVILIWFGSNFGAAIVVGFGYTLFIGVVVSMFSAVVVSRGLLRAVMAGRPRVNPAYFGMPTLRHAEGVGA
ncbi:MAG TPA: protein translocase subunit SecD [Chloroflexota bacterium]